MRLRTAIPSDRQILEYWDTKPHVVWAGGEDDAFDWANELPRDPPWRQLLIAEEADRPIGFMQIIDPKEEETHYWGDVAPNLRAIDIWIGEETDLGRGYGTEMMRLALERCFSDPDVTAVLIDPLARNVRAHAFYQRLGFRPVGRRMFDEDDCLVHRMERRAWSVCAYRGPDCL
ncbi:acetyltransferase [Hoeflea sp. WL0058]|uniref:Acetyltransferase n=1 Tax=Flavimaribacter sediminis TaxID=2865987 RepID=A0AAE2ZPI9_9HYPH|nr:GNAT family N-acetyltransferase [Flavimaribacter sediminis]MBW8637217.1 acetyltransferase [Flavimaribacter sediminis]